MELNGVIVSVATWLATEDGLALWHGPALTPAGASSKRFAQFSSMPQISLRSHWRHSRFHLLLKGHGTVIHEGLAEHTFSPAKPAARSPERAVVHRFPARGTILTKIF